MSILDKAQLHLIDSVDAAQSLFRWLSTRDVIAVDTETTGLSIGIDRVRLVQVGADEDGWAIPFERWGGVFEELVHKYEGIYVNHNLISYDVPMLAHEGIQLPRDRCLDTRLMCHVLESTGSTALKPQAAKHVDRRAMQMQSMLDEAMHNAGWTWETVPINFVPYWTYAALDTLLAFHLYQAIWPKVQADAPMSYELEAATTWVTGAMERRGVLVDRPYTQNLADRLTTYVEQMDIWCRTNYNVSPGSDSQVIAALQREGVQLTKKTKSGARYSIDKEVLDSLDHPLAIGVLNRRRADKTVGTYLNNYLEMSERDGRIHPSINVIGGTSKNHFEPGGGRGVRTGRMSMNNPNLQNVPVRTKAGKKIRDCFVPEQGQKWIKCDADQIEMRIFADQCADPGMMTAFQDAVSSGTDFFVEMAKVIFDDPHFQKSDPRRQWVKNGSYAWVYGAGIEKYAATVGISTTVAAQFMRRVDELYPGARRYIRNLQVTGQRHLAEDGEFYIRSPLTNRKHVADRGKEYALTNYLVQGTAAEVLKMMLVRLDQAGLADFATVPVHDEIDFDVPEEEVGVFVPALLDVVNDSTLFKVPLTWSVGIGDRWGSTIDL